MYDEMLPERKELTKITAKERPPLTREACRMLWEFHTFVHRGVDEADRQMSLADAAAGEAATAAAQQRAKQIRSLSQSDSERIEQLLLEFVDSTYGGAGRQMFLSEKQKTIDEQEEHHSNLALHGVGDESSAEKNEEGRLEEPGFAAMSLSGSPDRQDLVNSIVAAHRAKIIDADLAGSLLDCTGTPANREATLRNLQYSIRKHRAKVHAMSLNTAASKADEQSPEDYARDLLAGKVKPTLPSGPVVPTHPWGDKMQFPGRGDDPVADANGRRLAGLGAK